MTRAEIAEKVARALNTVAPEIDVAALRPNAPLRDQVDLDSMDVLRFVIELHKQLGVDVPESEYGQLTTLTRIVDYVQARAAISS